MNDIHTACSDHVSLDRFWRNVIISSANEVQVLAGAVVAKCAALREFWKTDLTIGKEN